MESTSMFALKELGEVIAESRLYLVGEPTSKIRILLGKPQKRPSASNDNFCLCPYQIVGIGNEKVMAAGGVDAFQALQLALEMIGAELYLKLNRQVGDKLRWEGGKQGDLSFPVPPGLEQDI